MGRGIFGGKFGDFTAYMCDSAATRPSSQITLSRLLPFLTNFSKFNTAQETQPLFESRKTVHVLLSMRMSLNRN